MVGFAGCDLGCACVRGGGEEDEDEDEVADRPPAVGGFVAIAPLARSMARRPAHASDRNATVTPRRARRCLAASPLADADGRRDDVGVRIAITERQRSRRGQHERARNGG